MHFVGLFFVFIIENALSKEQNTQTMFRVDINNGLQTDLYM